MLHENSNNTVTVKVLLFSVLKEKIGESEIILQLESEMTGSELLDLLAEKYMSIEAIRPAIRIAVNEAYVNDHHMVVDGDEIALITPVSGG